MTWGQMLASRVRKNKRNQLVDKNISFLYTAGDLSACNEGKGKSDCSLVQRDHFTLAL
jgi:hypothetical protein